MTSIRALVLVILLAAVPAIAGASTQDAVGTGDVVRLAATGGTTTGEFLRIERGQYVLRDDDERIVRVPVADVRTVEVERVIAGSGKGGRTALAFGLSTFAVGGLFAETASRERSLAGSDHGIAWLVTLVATPVMAAAGYVLGSRSRDYEWVDAQPPEEHDGRHARLVHELAAERDAARPSRPRGLSWSASF